MMKNEIRTIGIIAAMQVEIDGICEALENTETKEYSGMTFISGTLHGKTVVAAKSGVGKVFAAICAQTMILEYSPDCIINTGVAGGLAEELEILNVVVAQSVVQHDMDTSPLGDPVGMISGINIVEIPCDGRVVDALCKSVEMLGIHSFSGVIASGDQFVSSGRAKRDIRKTFNAAACEMEGAAVGQVCYVNKVPFGVIRAISDGGDEAAQLDFPEFAAKAARISIAVTEAFVKTV